MNDMDRDDLLMYFVLALQSRGTTLDGALSSADQRERIRIAILSQKLENRPFALSVSQTYGEAFQRCFGMAVNQRTRPRDAYGRPVAQVKRHGPDDDDDGGEDDSEESHSDDR